MTLNGGLFTIWRKIRFYRSMILLCLCAAALTISAGVVAGYLLYDGAFQLSGQIQSIGNFADLTEAEWQTITSAAKRERDLTFGLIGIGLATFLFGFLVPALVLNKLLTSLRELEQQLRETLGDLVKDFTATIEQYGDSAFVNAQYWAEVAMIALEFVGRDSRNPSLTLMADLSGLTRAEMAKIRRTQLHGKKPA